jgi:uncharacterized protein YecT (DUF1311 family)
MRTWIAVALFIFANCSFGHAQGLSQSEIAALQAKIMQHWNPPVENEGQTIIVRISLNRDGTLRVGPQILTAGSGSPFNALRDSAAKAVLLSAPYTMFRQESYEAWKEIDFAFDPRSLQQKQTNRSAATQASPPATGKPSFDCSKAKSASARLICSDAELSKADGALGAKFKTAVAGRDEAAKKQLLAEQLAWLRERNSRCGVGPDKASVSVEQLIGAKPCMISAIQARISSLTDIAASDTSIYYVANTTPPDAFLSLRTEPSTVTGQRIAQMPNGTELKVLVQQPDRWWRVRVVGTGQEGWALSGSGPEKINWIECCKAADAQRCTENFNVKKRNGDLPPGAELKGFLDWCMKQPPGESVAASSNVRSGIAQTTPTADKNDAVEPMLLNVIVDLAGCMNGSSAGSALAGVKPQYQDIFLRDDKLVRVLNFLWKKVRIACDEASSSNLTAGKIIFVSLVTNVTGYDVYSPYQSNDGVNWNGDNSAGRELNRRNAENQAARQQQLQQQQQQQQREAQQRIEVERQQRSAAAVKDEIARGVGDPVVGVWQSSVLMAMGPAQVNVKLDMEIRKEGNLYIVKTREGEFVGPLKDNQIQIGGMFGSVTLLASSGEILFAGNRYVRINK